MEFQNVLVVGGGRMGSQIACEYAIGGHDVTVVTRTESTAAVRIGNAFESALLTGLVDGVHFRAAQHRVTVVSSIDLVINTPDFIVESIIEDETAKGDLLRDVAKRWPNATIASNTSSLSITTLGRRAGAGDRVLGTHYWNPPLLMPLVEVITGDDTDRNRPDAVMSTLRALGKLPVVVARDVPGFVGNRLQFALLREAVWIVEQGVASPQVVDEIVRDGLARRWRYTGPFETMELGGATTFERVAANLFPELSCDQQLSSPNRFIDFEDPYLDEKVQRRDDGLRRDLMTAREETTES